MESKNGKTRFFTASDQDILDGRTTDVYFVRTVEVLKAKGMLHEEATAELTVARLLRDWKWSVSADWRRRYVLEGKNVDLWGLPEGTIFPSRTQSGVLLPYSPWKECIPSTVPTRPPCLDSYAILREWPPWRPVVARLLRTARS